MVLSKKVCLEMDATKDVSLEVPYNVEHQLATLPKDTIQVCRCIIVKFEKWPSGK